MKKDSQNFILMKKRNKITRAVSAIRWGGVVLSI